MNIRNTTADMNEPNSPDRLLFLATAMDGDGGRAFIQAQERAGQLQLVRSQMLPTKILHCTQADFEALGFTFGDPDPADPLFRPTTLPEGWTKRSSDHDMWSYVVDELGRDRVSVFYKAAFYDRDAHMGIQTLASYLRRCIWDGKEPVTDRTWATPAAIVQRAEAMAAECDERLAEYRQFVADGKSADYWTKQIPEVEGERDAILALGAPFRAAPGAPGQT